MGDFDHGAPVELSADHEHECVYLLVGAKTGVVSAWQTFVGAAKKRDAFNADPFIEPGMPDPDAPYEVQRWLVSDE